MNIIILLFITIINIICVIFNYKITKEYKKMGDSNYKMWGVATCIWSIASIMWISNLIYNLI